MSDLSDPNDMASAYEQKWLQAQIEEHAYQLSQAGNEWPYGLGKCKNCGESIDDGRAYCDLDCAKDFQARQKLNHVSGGIGNAKGRNSNKTSN